MIYLKKTPLYQHHVDLGARMVEYAGWNMPVQYAGIGDETAAVRNESGIFDVSHMGEVMVKGEDAAAFLDWLLSRPVSSMQPDQVTYAILANEAGGTVDDLLVYETGKNMYLLVVNAANKDKDVGHINDSLGRFKTKKGEVDVTVEDVSDQYGQIAWQGPKVRETAPTVLKALGFKEDDIEKILQLKRFRSLQIADPDGGIEWIVSRTGYTGEDGFEIYLPIAKTAEVWQGLIDQGIAPAGLGARDVLRLEAGMPLYGHELGENISALDAGLNRFVAKEGEFQGSKMRDTVSRKLIHIAAEGKAIPREGYRLIVDGEAVGTVSSGTFSPTLGKGIANVFVDPDFDPEGKELFLEIRNKQLPFTLVDSPFVKLG